MKLTTSEVTKTSQRKNKHNNTTPKQILQRCGKVSIMLCERKKIHIVRETNSAFWNTSNKACVHHHGHMTTAQNYPCANSHLSDLSKPPSARDAFLRLLWRHHPRPCQELLQNQFQGLEPDLLLSDHHCQRHQEQLHEDQVLRQW